jgi:hypothetical protein
MTTRLVLVLDLGGASDDPAEVRAYAERLLASIRQRQAAGADSVIEWRPEQLAGAWIEALDPSPPFDPAREHEQHQATGHRVYGCSGCFPDGGGQRPS